MSGWGEARRPLLPDAAAVVRVEVARLSPGDLLVIKVGETTPNGWVDAVNAACADSAFHGRVLVMKVEGEMVVLDKEQSTKQVVELPPLAQLMRDAPKVTTTKKRR